MRNEWLISLFVLSPFIACADDIMNATGETPAPPPSYKILRFDENYSSLSNASNRCDWADPVKYIPLWTNHPSWYVTLGGELRERFEAYHNPNFGVAGDHDAYWLQRISMLGDLHLSERLRFYVEGISGLMYGETQPPPPPQKDPYDLQFAFMDVVPYLKDDESLTLRAGRFGLSLGSGRLVATRAAPNIPFKFDGLEVLYQRPDWEATAFLTRPVLEQTYRFSSDDSSTAFWGLYVTHWLNPAQSLGFDLYYFGVDRDKNTYTSGTAREDRHTFGTRWFGGRDQWDWNGEAMFQTGTFGNETILAWAGAMDTGYTLNTMWQPRFGLKAGAASGNTGDSHQGTFDALYFKSGYFNDASLLRPENIISVHPDFTVQPRRDLSVEGGVAVFWRYSQDDGIYNPPGFIALPATRSASPYLGTAVDVNVEWRIQKHVSFQASYVHMATGEYVSSAGGGNVDYVSTTLSFLF
jgi:hypothetical protein